MPTRTYAQFVPGPISWLSSLVAFLLVGFASSQFHRVSYEILSEGEEIRVPLQNYF